MTYLVGCVQEGSKKHRALTEDHPPDGETIKFVQHFVVLDADSPSKAVQAAADNKTGEYLVLAADSLTVKTVVVEG
jgi:hypothetical protein